MLQMKDRALALMKVPVHDSGPTVGPPFEWMSHICSAGFLGTARKGRRTHTRGAEPYQRRLRRP
jgi:hypothetical protein